MAGAGRRRAARDGAQRSDGPRKELEQRFVEAARGGRCRSLDRGRPPLSFMLNARPFDTLRARFRVARAAEAEDGRNADRCCDTPCQSNHPCSRRDISLLARSGVFVLLRAPVASCPPIMAHLWFSTCPRKANRRSLRRFATLVITHGSGSVLSVSALSGAGLAWTSQSPRSYRRPPRWTPTAHARAGLAWHRRKRAYSRRRHSERPPWRHRCEP